MASTGHNATTRAPRRARRDDTLVLDGDSFDARDFEFTDPKPGSNGRSYAYVNNRRGRGKMAILMEDPMPLPFGGSKRRFQDDQPWVCSLSMAFNDVETEGAPGYSAAGAAYLATWRAIEERLVDKAAANPTSWIGRIKNVKDMSPEQIRKKVRGLMTPIVRPGRMNERTGKNYAPMVQVKVPLDAAGNPLVPIRLKRPGKPRECVRPEDALDLLTPHCRVRVTIRPGCAWFKRSGRVQKFGLSLYAESIEIFPREDRRRIVEHENFDPEAVVVEPDYRNSYGSPQARVGYGGDGKRIMLRTPMGDVMGNMMGDGVESFEGTVNREYLRLRFTDRDSPEVAAYLETMRGIRDVVKRTAVERREAWFGDGATEEDVDDFYSPVLRQIGDRKDDVELDESEPYYTKFKLPHGRDDSDEVRTWRPTFQDRDGTTIDGHDVYDALRRGTRARLVFQLNPIYIMQQSAFGMSLEAVAVEVDISLAEIEARESAAASGGNGQDHLFGSDEDDVVGAVEVEEGGVDGGDGVSATTPDAGPETVNNDDDDDDEYTDESDEDMPAAAAAAATV